MARKLVYEICIPHVYSVKQVGTVNQEGKMLVFERACSVGNFPLARIDLTTFR